MTAHNDGKGGSDMRGSGEGRTRYPISFLLLIGAAAVYLILRFIQMGGWLVEWLRG